MGEPPVHNAALKYISTTHRSLGINKVKNVIFILAAGFVEGSPFPPFYEKAKAKGWKTITVPCGHDVMLDLPEQLTKVLLDACEAQPIVT